MAIKTTVITGATSGIGEETALALAKEGHALYLLVRNIIKGDELKKRLVTETGNTQIYVVKCDLADLQSVSDAAAELQGKLFAINILINNAGGVFQQRELSKDRFEMTFTTNHLGHFLLTNTLMPLLQKGQARVINVSSEAHKMGVPQFDDLQWEQSYHAWKAYGMNKLFNIYFTQSLASKFGSTGILAFSLHPGVVSTGFWNEFKGFKKLLVGLGRSFFMISAKQGAETTVFLATAPRLDKYNGSYFKKKKVAKTSAVATDTSARDKLWAISEKLITR